MVILGITDGQTSGAAIVSDGKIISAVNEERLSRLKQARGFPRASIKMVMDLAGVNPSDIDAVAVAQANMEFKNNVEPWQGWFEERQDLRDSHNLFFNFASKFGGMVNRLPALKSLYYQIRKPIYQERRNRIKKIMEDEFSIFNPVRFLNHHYTHATSAYFTGGHPDALIITMDGGGDGLSSTVYEGVNGKLKNLSTVDSYDSLGNYYAYITAICGYKAKKHEGKITGLAAHGNPIYYEMLNQYITFSDGKTRNRGNVLFNSALKRIMNDLGKDYKKEDLAASIQKLSEDICRQYSKFWVNRTQKKFLALAGGVFANVRINQEINGIDGVKNVFVHPGMSDEGLAVGAALGLWAEMVQREGKKTKFEVIRDVYLGPGFSSKEIEEEIQKAGYGFEHHENIEKKIAELLAEGYVVARFNGRMEYGPRALGNRSILYQPADPSVNDWLNKNLIRTEFMPFAPSTMAEHAEQCFIGVRGALDTARFMTITFNCTEWMIKHCPGVVHIDGTARPQLVRPEDNLSYYKIIEEFYRITGLPCIINTSFNMHEEPIVCTPEDAIRAFKQGHLDYLALGNFLVKNKGPLSHHLISVKQTISNK